LRDGRDASSGRLSTWTTMPITITVDEPRRRVHGRADGIVTHADVVDYLAERRARGLLEHAALVDLNGAETNLTADQIRDLTDLRRRLRRSHTLGPTAVVAQNDLLYGMMRMYQILMEDADQFLVARDEGEAERWLEAIATREA